MHPAVLYSMHASSVYTRRCCVKRRSLFACYGALRMRWRGGLAGRMRPRDCEARQPASQCEYAVLYFQPSLLRPGLPRQLLLRCRNRFG
jgi:hypothetical protein